MDKMFVLSGCTGSKKSGLSAEELLMNLPDTADNEEDFKAKLIEIARKYKTKISVHVDDQTAQVFLNDLGAVAIYKIMTPEEYKAQKQIWQLKMMDPDFREKPPF